MKSFIVQMNWNTITEMMAGLSRGTMMCQSSCSALQPSITAASSMSRGMPRRNCTSMKTKKVSVAKAEGRISGR